MSFVVTLASVGMRMTPHEAIRGVMSAAAGTLNRDSDMSTLRVGVPADAVILDVPTASRLPYRFDMDPASTMLKLGMVARE